MNVSIRFYPIYQERVWGGRALEKNLSRTLPGGKKIGESWEIVDRRDAQSVVSDGPFEGKTLRELLEEHGEELMGPGYAAGRPFPILVKWLDCQERLSLQVHPPQQVAASLGGEPKTENWYIAAATEEASIFAGLRRGVTVDDFQKLLHEGQLESCVHRICVRTGDSILIPSGRVHAIGGGNLILEIQQNSDTTYRVYDWGRVGLDGKPRQLHVEASLKSIDFNDFEPEPLRAEAGDRTLADCGEFRIRKIHLSPEGGPLVFSSREEPRLLHIVEGSLSLGGGESTMERGENVLLPYTGDFAFEVKEPAVVLVTDRFVV